MPSLSDCWARVVFEFAKFRWGQTHLRQYEHTLYNLDFSNPVPADGPAPLLDTLKLYLGGRGANTYSRQQASVERREQAFRKSVEEHKTHHDVLNRKFDELLKQAKASGIIVCRKKPSSICARRRGSGRGEASTPSGRTRGRRPG